MANVFLSITDLEVTPKTCELGSGVRVDWKVKNAAGTLTTPAVHMQLRAVDQRGTELVAWTNATLSSTGIYYYLIESSVLLSSVLPGPITVYVRAREDTGPPTEDYKAKTKFYLSRGAA